MTGQWRTISYAPTECVIGAWYWVSDCVSVWPAQYLPDAFNAFRGWVSGDPLEDLNGDVVRFMRADVPALPPR
jgi:hypothetical protein